MKQAFNPIIKFPLVLCMLSLLCTGGVLADDIREAVFAGRFYPSSQSDLLKNINSLSSRAKKTQVKIPSGKHLKALILPHAGYSCSGLTAAHASLVLSEKQFKKVILLGPDHRVGFTNGAISDVTAYRTPLGIINLHKDAAKLRNRSELFHANKDSDLNEHSLEVLLPFLQYYLKQFKIIPIVISKGNIGGLTREIDMFRDKNTLLVASTDLSHFLPYTEAVEKDKKTIQMILNLDADNLLKGYNCACGKVPVLVLVSLAWQYGWQPVLLHYSNSGDTCGGRTQVVGYAAIAFYGDQFMNNKKNADHGFTDKQGQVLVRLARHSLMKKLNKKIDPAESEALEEALKEDCFQEPFGTFVTLKINDQLRGCIGNIAASEPVKKVVRRNAVSAAFRDPRFSPLRAEELDHVDIEVSILTPPELLEYTDGDDLVSKLRVNVDGVIIRKGSAGATFLPQVWKQVPEPEEFLGHLCIKAGLSAHAWRNDKPEVKIYQVQYFDEEK
ncbi:MAG: AmmeMemoRadiSam system protein B [Deltaproteobacteria bacterium]|nr:AmmeMemoRadiSam system protein B [Deltaproteobacteria bacterium]